MLLESLRIQNFRAFADVTVLFNPYTCLVGPNGAGKSTVIAALNALFRQSLGRGQAPGILSEQDFHQRNTSEPIRITATFGRLSEDAKADLTHYVRHDKLLVIAVARWDAAERQATVVQHGIRLVNRDFAGFFAAVDKKAKAAELTEIYAQLRTAHPDLPAAKSKDAMGEALRAFEESHPELNQECESANEFYGATGTTGPLSRHFQWVHVPAVKDPGEEESEAKNTWLGQLLQRAVRGKISFDEQIKELRDDARKRYEAIVGSQQPALAELSKSLTERMTSWAHPDAHLALRWDLDMDRALSISPPNARVDAGDSGFEGDLTRQGHGFQRSYLLALLQELAATGRSGSSTLFLGIEEPELFQHPPQARHLAGVLEALAESGTQVAICTHSPLFVNGRVFSDIRIARKRPGQQAANLAAATIDQVQEALQKAYRDPARSVGAARIKLHQQLQPATSEMFFASTVVLVEGPEDAAYLTAHLHLTGRISDFRRLGCHIVPAGRKSDLPLLLAVAKVLGISTFTMFDADGDQCEVPTGATPEQEKKAQSLRGQHQRDNVALLALCGAPAEAPFPAEAVWRANCVVWPSNLTSALEDELGESLERAREEVRSLDGLRDHRTNKSALFVGETLEALYGTGRQSTLLDKLCTAILTAAAPTTTPSAAARASAA